MADNTRIVSDAHRLMIEELQRIRPQKSTNQGVMICCPFHADSTPSLSINLTYGKKPLGLWCCFGGCGGGRWNKLAKKLNLRQIDEKTAQQLTEFHGRKAQHKLLDAVNTGRADTITHWELDFLEPWPTGRKWRGFPGRFINRFGGELAVDSKRKAEVLMLPVQVAGEDQGFVKALLKKQKRQLSYVNSPGEWSKTSGLLGYDMAAALLSETEARVLFIVEGPRDALRLLYYGVPAVAVLGAHIWSSAKRDLALMLAPEKIVIWMDSDEAGTKSTKMLRRSFAGHVPVVYVNGEKALATAKKKWAHTQDKLDVGNAPLGQFLEISRRHVPEARAGLWTTAYLG